MAQIKLQYLVKDIITKRYEIHELMHDCDPNKGDRENLDDAFVKACSLGANPNKQVRWRFIN
jgi:hypothetical protein